MNRIDRVSAILIQLQSRKIVKAQDIADRFSISLRTVYRDMKTLEEAGVPIIGEAGVGYSIMEGYRLPPVMFTREEATAFLTAGKLIEKFTDHSTHNNYVSAMDKVRAVLRGSEKNELENIEDHIEVLQNYAPFADSEVNNLLPTLLKSISGKEVLHVRYAAMHSGETTERCIEPVGIYYSGGYWYSIAYCRLRKDYRNFRTDRIVRMHLTSEIFTASHPSLKTFLNKIAREENLETIVINVRKDVARYLRQQKFYYGFVSEKETGGNMQMTFLTAYIDPFIRWLSMFADYAEIVSPASLTGLLKAYICKLSQKFS
ncbi:MAG: YafY family transcriptional regulator [Bacteroidetes bacterium]|nr:YafY family transcriptional regulator [Bacteroidota bacterium]